MAALNSDIDLNFIISFVIVTVLYGSLISPQISRLANIRDKIADQQFPIRNQFLDKWENRQKHEKDIAEARKSLEGYFYEYELKYKYLKKFLMYFWASVFLVVGYALGTSYYSTIFLHSHGIRVYVFILWIVFILYILNKGLMSYILDEDTIRRFDWLANNAGINQFSLLQVMNGRMYLTNNKDFFEPSTIGDPIHIHYLSDINITGYRYYLEVFDNHDDTKVYFVSYGPMGKKTTTNRSIERDGSYSYITDLGSFQLNLLKNKELGFRLYIFANAYNLSESSPYYIVMFQETTDNDGRYMTGRSSTEPMNIEKEDNHMSFGGEGYNLKNLKIDDRSLINTSVFKYFKKDFLRSNKVTTHYYHDGVITDNKLRLKHFLTTQSNWLK